MSDLRTIALYLEACEGIEQAATLKIGRDLLPQELAAMRNAGTLMFLESVGMTVDATEPEDLPQMLVEVGASNEDRRCLYCRDAIAQIETQLHRPLTETERNCIATASYATDIMALQLALNRSPDGDTTLKTFCDLQTEQP